MAFSIKNIFSFKSNEKDYEIPQPPKRSVKAYGGLGYEGMINLGERALVFNGEKSLGSMGAPIHYIPDYYMLATRSWQAYLDSPIAIAIISKWVNWIVGEGLKLKSNPSILVLESEGVTMTKKERERFNDVVEARFTVWSESKSSSFCGEMNFNEKSREIYLNSKINGDTLVVLKLINGMVKVHSIDGSLIVNPSTYIKNDKTKLFLGVEINIKDGSVFGYHVRKANSFETEFIPAYSRTGVRQAFLVKGTKWRMNYHRGLPSVASTLETISKIDRYQDATLGSAEELANIVYQVVHSSYSTGENVDAQEMIRAAKLSAGNNETLPTDDLGQEIANKIAITTGNRAYNNPKGAEIKTVDKKSNISGNDEFYTTNTDIVCAAIGIPPNVAKSIYNDSFSASRAATKDWDHTMDVERYLFYSEFLSYVYKFWLFSEVLMGKISAMGYLEAHFRKSPMLKEAYEIARFTGPHFPHIDPLKEVKAQREMLGILGKTIPLTTVEKAMEELGTGDSDSVMEQFADELEISKDLNLVEPVVEPVAPINV